MKKALTLILTLILCLSLYACKSKEVTNVETQIATLNANSTYAEIHSVYSLYSSLSSKDKEKVENVDILEEYCDPHTGNFVLSYGMLQEIADKFKTGYSGISSVESSVLFDLSINSVFQEWHDYGDIEITSHEQTDDYTYCVYGTFKVADEYGSTSKHKFKKSYYAKYSEEETVGYTISDSFNFYNF